MDKTSFFNQYLKQLHEISLRGDATEESYYVSLDDMLHAFAQATRRTQIHITTLPKPTEAGNPDFRVWNGTDHIIGYIEAKRPEDEYLDHTETSNQLHSGFLYRDLVTTRG